MQPGFLTLMALVVSSVWATAGYSYSPGVGNQEERTAASGPHYSLTLTLNEFSILNVAEMDGLLRYGGSGDFRLSMAKVGNEVLWTVTIDDPRLMELLGIFVGEKTMRLLQGLDPDNLDSNQKIALQAVKSLTQKMEQALKSPYWNSIKLVGTVAQTHAGWMLRTENGTFGLAGEKIDELKKLNGRQIVVDGFVKAPGQLEITGFVEKRENTLDLFVMSFCPFAQQAEINLVDYLAKTNIRPKPSLEVHYILSKQRKDGKDVFTSLHGEIEVLENLVQMAIRDHYPRWFEAYLKLRAESGKTPWNKLAEQLGIRTSDVKKIEQILGAERDQMLSREYEYSTRYGVIESSPSYVWESERVIELGRIEAFKGLPAPNRGECVN